MWDNNHLIHIQYDPLLLTPHHTSPLSETFFKYSTVVLNLGYHVYAYHDYSVNEIFDKSVCHLAFGCLTACSVVRF